MFYLTFVKNTYSDLSPSVTVHTFWSRYAKLVPCHLVSFLLWPAAHRNLKFRLNVLSQGHLMLTLFTKTVQWWKMKTANVRRSKEIYCKLESMIRDNVKTTLNLITWNKRSGYISTYFYIFTFICVRKYTCNFSDSH